MVAMSKAPFGPIVWPYAISQTVSWAAMFYLFPALFGEWEQQFGWSKAKISIALTACLLLSASFAPVAGKIIDKGHFVALHIGGTIFAVILLSGLSQVTQYWQFLTIWSLMGITMACVLYEPCFAILTRTFKMRARAAITRVTLVAGLAGTIAFPASHLLVNQFGWRFTVIIFAGFVAVISVPLAWSASKKAQNFARSIDDETSGDAKEVKQTLKKATFWFLALAYFAFALDHSMILTHLLPMLQERGIEPAQAVIAAAFIGPMQVAGRIVMIAMEKKASTVLIAVSALVALVISAICLLGSGYGIALIVIFVILQGAGNGISSIVRPLLTGEILGLKNFGVISGFLALPFIGGFAIGPTLSAAFWRIGGYDLVLYFAIGICVAGIASLLIAANIVNRKPEH